MTSGIQVRDYTPTDLKQVEEIILTAENFGRDFLDHERRVVRFHHEFPDSGRILVASEKATAEIVGYAAIRYGWRALIIESIITEHNHLRLGIGRLMMDHIKQIGEDHPDMEIIRVDTGDFMDYAQAFYLACGFQISGFASHYLSWHNNQVIFVYRLKQAHSINEGG